MITAPNEVGTDGFTTMPARLHGELAHRQALAARALNYHQTFLDDCLRKLLPHDLVLIGAPSGIGKTDLALSIAVANARQERRCHYFALEAEVAELERRTKYGILVREAYRTQHPQRHEMNYTDWLLGDCEHVCGDLNAIADHQMLATLGNLWTYYRGAKFDASDLQKSVLEIHKHTDLIIIDHLHYIDADSDDNEQRALGDTVKTIRDISLRIGKPIILVAHLRKRDLRTKQLIATLDDFHGSSNIVKICTQAITIERAHNVEAPKWYLAPTYVSVLKDRRAGAPGVVAVSYFDRRTKTYSEDYTLGRLVKGGSEWEELTPLDKPSWARNHRPLDQIGQPRQQEISNG